METFSALLAFCAGNSQVTSEFPAQRPVTRSFDVFFYLRLNQHLTKQCRRRWFETPSRSYHYDIIEMLCPTCKSNAQNLMEHSCMIAILIANAYKSDHYNDVIMTTIASQITSFMVVYSTVYSNPDQRKHQSSASLAFVWGIHRDRWIPRTKGQLRGKCFHLMTSSCNRLLDWMYDGRWCVGETIVWISRHSGRDFINLPLAMTRRWYWWPKIIG